MLIALTPLLPFVGTSYSNDILSLVLMALGLGGLLRLLDLRQSPQWRWSLVAGIGLGLSILTKLYALPLMIAIARGRASRRSSRSDGRGVGSFWPRWAWPS